MLLLYFKILYFYWAKSIPSYTYHLGYNQVGCAFTMVVVSILLHAEFGQNDHRSNAPHFMKWRIYCKEVSIDKISSFTRSASKRANCPYVELNAMEEYSISAEHILSFSVLNSFESCLPCCDLIVNSPSTVRAMITSPNQYEFSLSFSLLWVGVPHFFDFVTSQNTYSIWALGTKDVH